MNRNNSNITNMKPFIQDIWKKSGFSEPTHIQRKTMPLILDGKDMVAESPTGTGKTLAYLLPVLEKLDESNKALQAVILAPSRELVMQIYQEIQKWTEGTAISKASFVGGANIKRQLEKLKERPQIVAGTPGRILELIKLKKLKMHEVTTIVLDEGDQLLSPEHLSSVRTIIKSSLNDRQLLLFSATSLKDGELIKAMIGREPVKAHASRGEEQPSGVSHYYMLCEPRDRTKLLKKIAILDGVKALAFVRDVGSMNVLAEKLAYEGVSLGLLHSDLRKNEREKALSQLRSGEIQVLLATDVAARGLDIQGLTHVIHYDFPANQDQYIHRSGRTGRMGASGTVVSFVTEREERELKKFGRELHFKPELKRLYKDEFVDASKKKK